MVKDKKGVRWSGIGYTCYFLLGRLEGKELVNLLVYGEFEMVPKT